MVVNRSEIGAALNFRHEELFRIAYCLKNRGCVAYLGAGPRVCITANGIEYLEVLAGTRRSIRG